jgi:hypothetical protein
MGNVKARRAVRPHGGPVSPAERRALARETANRNNFEDFSRLAKYLAHDPPPAKDMAELKRVNSEFAGTLPPPEEYALFWRWYVAPNYRRLGLGVAALCVGCGKPLVMGTLKIKRFCSAACAASRRMKGRNRTKSRTGPCVPFARRGRAAQPLSG